MTIPTLLFIVAFILAAIDLIRSEGRSLTGWAVVLVCVGLLWGAIR